MDCSPPGLPVPGILQARILEWLAIAYFRVSTHSTYYFLCLKFPSGLIYSKWLPPCTNETHGNVEGHTVVFLLFLDNYNCFRAPLNSMLQFSSVQSLSRVRLFESPWITAHQASLSITNSRSSPRLTAIESVMPSSHLILSSPSPPAPNPSQHQSLFQWVNSSHEVAKVLEFQL